MNYYTHNGNLYTSNLPINSEDFIEITKEEYDLKLSEMKVVELPVDTEDYWGTDTATESDYIKALESLGVEFNG